MSEQEDLAAAQATVKQEYHLMYQQMSMLADMADNPEGLKNCGHATLADAFLYTFKESQKKIKKIWADHLRKYPD